MQNDELSYDWLALDDVVRVLGERPWMQHVAVTGRSAPDALVEKADTVTEMTLRKHAFRSGAKAMPSIEW
jgi:cob(I)alamin adenosyltransferase